MAVPNRPNILLITTDQQRGDALGINGNRWLETPNLDHLAARGVNFTRAYSTCPVCIPARRTLLTGLSPDTHGLRRYQDGAAYDPPFTLPGCLSAAGYQTQLIGKMHQHPQGRRFGFDHIILSETSNSRPESSFQKRNDYATWLRDHGVAEHPHSHGISGNGRLVRTWGLEERWHHSNWLKEEACRFLTERRDPSCPVFLHLSFCYPHPPLVPLASYFQRYAEKNLPGPNLGDWCSREPRAHLSPDSATGPFDEEIIRRTTAAYYAQINHIDDCIAHVLERWTGYGSAEPGAPLYILFSSDHGEMLGDHHLFRKSLGYESSARVPFFLSGHNVDLPQVSTDALVCWEDVAPTLLDLAGVPIPDAMEGRSLAGFLRGEPPGPARDHVFGQCEGYFHNLWITTPRWKYLWFPKTNEEQLFDLIDDPREDHDLSGSSEALTEMRSLMAARMEKRSDLSYRPAELRPCANRPPRIFWS